MRLSTERVVLLCLASACAVSFMGDAVVVVRELALPVLPVLKLVRVLVPLSTQRLHRFVSGPLRH